MLTLNVFVEASPTFIINNGDQEDAAKRLYCRLF